MYFYRYFAAYFIINEPSKTVQWGNNITNFATWTIDAGSEVSVFDVELGRLSMDGLHFIARNGIMTYV